MTLTSDLHNVRAIGSLQRASSSPALIPVSDVNFDGNCLRVIGSSFDDLFNSKVGITSILK